MSVPAERVQAILVDIDDLCRQGKWLSALDRCMEGLRFCLAVPLDTPLPGESLALLERAADLAVPFRFFEAADALLSAIALAQSQAGHRVPADYATIKRAHLALETGHLDNAFDCLVSLQEGLGPLDDVPIAAADMPAWEAERWRGLEPDARRLLLTHCLLVMGRWLAANGFYGQSTLLLKRGQDLAAPPGPSLVTSALVPLQLALAAAFLEQGRFGDVADILAALEGQLDRRAQPGPAAAWLGMQIRLDLLRGDLGGALRRSADVALLCFECGFRRAAIDALLNHAGVLIGFNHASLAEEVIGDALAAWRPEDGPAARLRAAWLARLAAARACSPVGATPVTPTVHELWYGPSSGPATPPPAEDPAELPAVESYLAFFEDRALSIVWALAHGRVAEAAGRLAELVAVFGPTDSDLIQTRIAALQGTVAYARDDHAAAADALHRAESELTRLGMLPELWQVVRQLGWCASRTGRSGGERAVLDRRAADLLNRLSETFDPADRAVYLLNKWTTEERALTAEIEELEAQRAAALASLLPLRLWRQWQVGRRLHFLLERLDRHTRQLASRAVLGGEEKPEPESRRRAWWLDLWRRPRRRATLSFLVLPDRVFVARSGWLDLTFQTRALTRVRLREQVAAWHCAAYGLAPLGADPHSWADALAGALGLAGLLDGLPARVRSLTFVPDDALHGFPFAALTHAGRPLVESFAVSVAFTRVSRRDAAKRPPGPALTLAVSRGTSEVPPLPGTLLEVGQVAEWLAARGVAVEALADDGAGREAVLRAWERAAFVHAACHGEAIPDRPDASGLVLIPRPGKVERVSLRDLAGLGLRRLHHVTLSSCWGADGFVLPGRWVVSLPWTLCSAGAGSVLGCLWPVDDEVSPAFMASFYRHLDGLPRDQALQAAQCECLRGKLPLPAGRCTKDPFYWAGFQLYGDPDPLVLPTEPSSLSR